MMASRGHEVTTIWNDCVVSFVQEEKGVKIVIKKPNYPWWYIVYTWWVTICLAIVLLVSAEVAYVWLYISSLWSKQSRRAIKAMKDREKWLKEYSK